VCSASADFTLGIGRRYNWSLSAPRLYEVAFCAAGRLARVTIPVALDAPELGPRDVAVELVPTPGSVSAVPPGYAPCWPEMTRAAAAAAAPPAVGPRIVEFVCDGLPPGHYDVKFIVNRRREPRAAGGRQGRRRRTAFGASRGPGRPPS
jgi:hypothetical protein